MKKSDLPWMLPLLTAWSQGKTLQVWSTLSNQWKDWTNAIAPDGISPGGSADYRIKPELKTPFQVYTETTYPSYSGVWGNTQRLDIVRGLTAVIKAYKACELELTEELK